MLSRRHIRLKVMQSLYSFMLSSDNDMPKSERAMLKHFDEVVELKLAITSLVVELVKYAANFYEKGKEKHLPSDADLNPNTKFLKNRIAVSILADDGLMQRVSKISGIWLRNDHDVVRKLFMELYNSPLYERYLLSDINSLDSDKRFIIDMLNDYLLKNDLVHHILEERSIYWIDDLPFIATIVFGAIKDGKSLNPKDVFKDSSDKGFALKLFRTTIINDDEYNEIIKKFARNWDLDRIAIMDKLLLNRAFSDILSMPELPVKVSMNEYIEISKYYSTAKSKLFVNGLLDSFVKLYESEGKIMKEGRGLVE